MELDGGSNRVSGACEGMMDLIPSINDMSSIYKNGAFPIPVIFLELS